VLSTVELDMAPYIGKSPLESTTRVSFPKIEYTDAVLEIEFKFQEGDGEGKDSGGEDD
jgi:hypothetical protein